MLAHAPPPALAPPAFGRFELKRLLGRSSATIVWLGFDTAAQREVVLTLPRVVPPGVAALDRWLLGVQHAARLDHPQLARSIDIGVHDRWPYVAAECAPGGTSFVDALAAHPSPTPADAVAWACQLLQGLATAHDAGVAHGDLQCASLWLDARGQVQLIGLGVAGPPGGAASAAASGADAGALQAHRAAAARDVLACGLLLRHLLAGPAGADAPDFAQLADRLAQGAREPLHLATGAPRPVPDALRAILDRCTASAAALRYLHARTLLGALSGWLDARSTEGAGPIARLIDRLQSVGHLPALPGLAARVARITQAEGQRTEAIADQVLGDLALTFELLRTLNSARVQGTQVQGNGPVLTLRRIVALIGVDGVRHASNTLRAWPGALAAAPAAALQHEFDRVRLAAHTARALRPRGYDAQVVHLIAALQNLGPLMLHYHFADEAEQMRRLMLAASAPGDASRPVGAGMSAGVSAGMSAGMSAGVSEAAAAFTVLGVDTAALGAAVAQHWRLGDEVVHLARRLPLDAPVRKAESDAEVLRQTASAANEAVDAVWGRDPAHTASALNHVAQRYGRGLGWTVRELHDALREGQRQVGERQAPA